MNNISMPLLGGILIGIASTILWGGIGRITGISGITGTVLTSLSKDNYWRLVWLLGLLTGGIIMLNLYPSFFNFQISSSPGRLIIAGLLVGFGTRLGSGCTSGHGVCGTRSNVCTIPNLCYGIYVFWYCPCGR